MTEQFKLVAKEVPTAKKTTLYDDILKDFVKSERVSALVQAKKRPATLHQGLLKANKAGKYGVRVVRRGEEVYVVKG